MASMLQARGECTTVTRRGPPSLADQILAYLARNPHARDTRDGIRQWWLPTSAATSPKAVEAALRELVEKGHLSESEGPDGHVHYSAADSRTRMGPAAPAARRRGPRRP
jgi:hypothetical protein